jgi:hypothetical protein
VCSARGRQELIRAATHTRDRWQKAEKINIEKMNEKLLKNSPLPTTYIKNSSLND